MLVSGQLQPWWAEGRRSCLARVRSGIALPLGEQLPYMWVSAAEANSHAAFYAINKSFF